mmetsp:Transcript_78335/g.207960  ORF Transcript_78335/g.207960 Transcript_78335/m.207960 type:complete len:239 (-) Transcript_78335:599-1315(-)
MSSIPTRPGDSSVPAAPISAGKTCNTESHDTNNSGVISSRCSRSRPVCFCHVSTRWRSKSTRRLSRIRGFTQVTMTTCATSSICPFTNLAHIDFMMRNSTSFAVTRQCSAISSKLNRRCVFGFLNASSISAKAHILGLKTVLSADFNRGVASICARCFDKAASYKSNLPSPKAWSKSLIHACGEPSRHGMSSCCNNSPKLNSSSAINAATPISKASCGRSFSGIVDNGVNFKYKMELL